MVRGKWTSVPSPKVSNDQSNALNSVSCTSPKNCFAVGTSAAGWAPTFVERWNGAKWKVVTSVNPRGCTLSQFNGISCATPTNCVATGLYLEDFVTRFTLINRWNGQTWAIESSAEPRRAAGSSLTGVSCARDQGLLRGRHVLHEQVREPARRVHRAPLLNPSRVSTRPTARVRAARRRARRAASRRAWEPLGGITRKRA